MPFNGSGTYNRTISWVDERDASNPINATKFDTHDDDLASALSQCITKDGQTTVTGNLPMSGFRHTGVDDAVAANEYAAVGQVQDGAFTYLTSIVGADNITASSSPALTAYAAGQSFWFIAAGANTTSPTININSLGSRALTKWGGSALEANDILSGMMVMIIFDGTNFEIIEPAKTVTGVFASGDALTCDSNGRVTSTGYQHEQQIPTGTIMVVKQSFVPTGWTLHAFDDDRVLINDSTAASGGSTGGQWQINSIIVDPHSITVAELALHSHGISDGNQVAGGSGNFRAATGVSVASSDTGNNAAHDHTLTITPNWRPLYVNVISVSKNAP